MVMSVLGVGRGGFPGWTGRELQLLVSVAGHEAWAWLQGLAQGLVGHERPSEGTQSQCPSGTGGEAGGGRRCHCAESWGPRPGLVGSAVRPVLGRASRWRRYCWTPRPFRCLFSVLPSTGKSGVSGPWLRGGRGADGVFRGSVRAGLLASLAGPRHTGSRTEDSRARAGSMQRTRWSWPRAPCCPRAAPCWLCAGPRLSRPGTRGLPQPSSISSREELPSTGLAGLPSLRLCGSP